MYLQADICRKSTELLGLIRILRTSKSSTPSVKTNTILCDKITWLESMGGKIMGPPIGQTLSSMNMH